MALLTFSVGGRPGVPAKCPQCGKHAEHIWFSFTDGDRYDMAHDWYGGTWAGTVPPDLHMWSVPSGEVE